jgi:two-component system sensor histidine kinase MprB
MRRLVERWRQVPLRARLAALVAVAVAAMVIVVSLSAWLLIRSALLTRVDQDLRDRARIAGPQVDLGRLLALQPYLGDANPTVVQGLGLNGDPFFSPAVGALPVKPQDLAVARREKPQALHDVKASGHTYRVLTVPADGGLVRALMWGRPLDDVEDTLGKLALLLTVVGVVGVAASGALGLVVARTGLKPVDRLTSAAEHVAATQDLSSEIEVGPGDDEVARLARSFNGMLAALADARRAQRQLVEDASHELRTPLTSLRTNVELLLRAEERGPGALPEDERRQLLLDVRRQMVELSTLTTELVSLARDEATPESVVHLDLAEVVREALDRASARRPGLTVDARLEPAFVVGRAHGLERAVLNLVDNAAKWSPEDGVVEVRLDRPDRPAGWVRVTVADRGPGIDLDDLPRVFERFYRAPAARSMPGSGLGLAIVRQAVEADGGRVRAANRAGGGAVVEVLLPLAGSQVTAHDLPVTDQVASFRRPSGD